MHLVILLSHEEKTCKIYKFQTGWDYVGHLDRLSGRGILSKLSGRVVTLLQADQYSMGQLMHALCCAEMKTYMWRHGPCHVR